MSTQDDIASFVRLAGGAYLRSAEWAVRGALGALGVKSPQDEPRRAGGPPTTAPTTDAQREERRLSLRERGEELLRRSADVREDEEGHPAYERILDELLPDEARILRLLHRQGPQP